MAKVKEEKVEKEPTLTDIPGIGPGIALKLEAAGVYDLMGLAVMSPAALSDMAGVGQAVAPHPRSWGYAAQVSGVAVHAHSGYALVFGRVDSRGSRYHGTHVRQSRDPRCHHAISRIHRRR